MAQPRSGAALRAVHHVQRRRLSSSYLPPAHFANAALTRFFFFPLSLPPSLLLSAPCRDAQTVLPIQLQARGLPPAHALHTLTRLQVVLLGRSKFTLFPFSGSPGALVLAGGAPVNKEGGWCELCCCQGGDLAPEPAAPARPPMSLEVRPRLPRRAARFLLG